MEAGITEKSWYRRSNISVIPNTSFFFPPCVFWGLAVFILKQDFKVTVLAAT
jgi:hypothetical protein